MENGVVIIGASIAGVNVVKELRKKGYEGKITLLDQQSDLPYDLLPLSKEWMLDLDDIKPPLLKKPAYYKDEKIDLKLNTEITQINPDVKTIETAQGEAIPYDQLVIAIGSTLRTLDVSGGEAAGIFYLRDFKNASDIKNWGKTVKDLVIVGAGFIGLEMASTFSQLGKNVTVVEFSDHPLGRILGEDASEYFTNMHRSHGVKILTGEAVQAFEHDEKHQVSAVVTQSGKKIPCQMAIVGVGVTPNTSISHPDLKVEKGIVVNEFGETSLPDIYAAGDCTVWPYQDQQIHIEHWEHAHDQGKAVARNLIQTKSNPYTIRPYFWSDQYDETFEYLGHATKWHRQIMRGSIKDRQYTIAYVDEHNFPLAILFANEGDQRDEVTAFLNKNKVIDPIKFKNMSNPIQDL